MRDDQADPSDRSRQTYTAGGQQCRAQDEGPPPRPGKIEPQRAGFLIPQRQLIQLSKYPELVNPDVFRKNVDAFLTEKDGGWYFFLPTSTDVTWFRTR